MCYYAITGVPRRIDFDIFAYVKWRIWRYENDERLSESFNSSFSSQNGFTGEKEKFFKQLSENMRIHNILTCFTQT